MDGGLKFRPMTLPDRYIEHGTQVGGGSNTACGLVLLFGHEHPQPRPAMLANA